MVNCSKVISTAGDTRLPQLENDMGYTSDVDRYHEAQEAASGAYDTAREPIERAFWKGELAGEFAEYADASDLAYLSILLIKTPWDYMREAISAWGSDEYERVKDAIEGFIDEQTRMALGWY